MSAEKASEEMARIIGARGEMAGPQGSALGPNATCVIGEGVACSWANYDRLIEIGSAYRVDAEPAANVDYGPDFQS